MQVKPISVTPTVTAGAYAANDVVGARLQFHSGEGLLHSVRVADNGNQATGYYLYLFSSVPTDITDNAVFDPADADLPNIIHRAYLDVGDAYVANDSRINLKEYTVETRRYLKSKEGDKDIWGFLVCVGTPSYVATSDITVVLEVEN